MLVVIGLGITLAGAAGLWATVLAAGTAVSVWALAPILVLSAGMVARRLLQQHLRRERSVTSLAAEAGSASGALSAVQQLGRRHRFRRGHDRLTSASGPSTAPGSAMTVSVAVVAAIAV